jgi:hypothetical protein
MTPHKFQLVKETQKQQALEKDEAEALKQASKDLKKRQKEERDIFNQQRRQQAIQKRSEADAIRQIKKQEREDAAVARKALQDLQKAQKAIKTPKKKPIRPSLVVERHIVVIDVALRDKVPKNVTSRGSRMRRAPK